MALISLLQLVLGNAFVVRTTQVFRSRNVLGDANVTKTGTGFLAINSLSVFGYSVHPFAPLGMTLIAVVSVVVVMLGLERRTLGMCRASVPRFLDRWILNVRMGHSLKAARDTALREESERFQALVRPIFSTRAPADARHELFSAGELRELEAICLASHAALDRLKALRAHVQKTSEFRRRSGQALRQANTQSSVMGLLMFAFAVLTVRRYGWRSSADLVVFAAMLSVAGVLILRILARKRRWKI